jgi:starch phosphorylase
LNGGLILGTVDGANVEIAEEAGDDQVFFFGNLTENGKSFLYTFIWPHPTRPRSCLICNVDGCLQPVAELRHAHVYRDSPMPPDLAVAIEAIKSGTFGDARVFEYAPIS